MSAPTKTRAAPPLEYSLLLTATLCLLAVGAVMVFSASSATSLLAEGGGDGFYYLKRTLLFAAIGLFAMASAVPVAMRLGNEFMPPLNEGDLLYMPITFPNISIEEAKRQLQYQDRMLRSFPEVVTVFGKVGRAESATDPAPITMVETTVQLRPPSEWRKKHQKEATPEQKAAFAAAQPKH